MRPTLALGMPTGFELLACFLIFLIAVGVTIFVVLRITRKTPPVGFPVGPALPGRFRVSGVKRDTREDIVWTCDADSPQNAQVKAELEGIVVTHVDRVGPTDSA